MFLKLKFPCDKASRDFNWTKQKRLSFNFLHCPNCCKKRIRHQHNQHRGKRSSIFSFLNLRQISFLIVSPFHSFCCITCATGGGGWGAQWRSWSWKSTLAYSLSNSNRNRAQSTIHSYQHTNQTISFHKLKEKENIRLRKQLSISAVKGYFFFIKSWFG